MGSFNDLRHIVTLVSDGGLGQPVLGKSPGQDIQRAMAISWQLLAFDGALLAISVLLGVTLDSYPSSLRLQIHNPVLF
jgi:hypothetical protein